MSPELLESTADFLTLHLGRFGDPKEEIILAEQYAMSHEASAGGFVCLGVENNQIIAAAVVNRTGMTRYIPENILVYIAVHDQMRGRGLGRQLLREIIHCAEGGIALHVEADNPARQLYESLGFTNKYLEMRLERKEVK